MSDTCKWAAVDKALSKQTRLAEADALRRIEAATAQALQSVKPPSPQTSLFQKSSRNYPSTPPMVASDGPIQKELGAALDLRVAQQQSQDVAWNRRAAPKVFREVRRVVQVLTAKVSGCKEALNAQEVSNALYRLQDMSSEHAKVRTVLQALTAKVSGCNVERAAIATIASRTTMTGC